MDEFALIDRLIEVLGDRTRGPGVVLGPGDDAALVEIPPGHVSVSSIDALVAGTHFPRAAPPRLIGHRALGVSVSDLAAMGAEPLYALISVTLPDGAADWLDEFSAGAADAAQRMCVAIVGGNLARGPLSVTVSVCGHVAAAEALLRSGACVGDLICVSGVLGGAALALARDDLEGAHDPAVLLHCDADDPAYPLRRYFVPEPQIALARALRGIATAAIDVSDGLVADLGHLCRASGVAARIDLDSVPCAAGCDALLAATAGDDYELCFTVAPASRALLASLPARVSVIGEIHAGSAVTVLAGADEVSIPRTGFSHFS